MKIGFIGTGLLGTPMVKKLLENNYNLKIYNRTLSKIEELVNLGAQKAESFRDVVESSDVIMLVLSDYSAVCQTLFQDGYKNFSNKTVINMSTIAPGESELLAERVQENGGVYLEAPVLGSIPQVMAGELIVIGSGSEESFSKAQEVLKTFSGKFVYAGNFGKASSIKLALNHLIASLTASFSLSLGYLRENEIDPEIYMGILRESALYAPTFDKKLGKMLNRDFENPNFPLKHLLKDVSLMLDDFKKNNLNTIQLDAVKEIIKSGLAKGLEEKDYSSLYNAVHPEKVNPN